MAGLFEKYSYTQEAFSDENLNPISLNLGVSKCIELIVDYLNDSKFENLYVKEEFHEIFAAKNIIEYTISVIPDGASCIVNVSTYCLKKGKSRKALKELVKDLRLKLNKYLK